MQAGCHRFESVRLHHFFPTRSDSILCGSVSSCRTRLRKKPFNIVQRDNQRCWPHPSGGAVVDDLRIIGPTAALSKSSTLTKCATPAWDLRKCPFRMEGAGNVHAFDRKRSGAGSKRPRPEGRQVLLLPDQIKRDKGVWWMPWQQEAMKDVIPCDKPWGAGNRL